MIKQRGARERAPLLIFLETYSLGYNLVVFAYLYNIDTACHILDLTACHIINGNDCIAVYGTYVNYSGSARSGNTYCTHSNRSLHRTCHTGESYTTVDIEHFACCLII